ncbi:hypothetical protein BC938DRAFT_477289 [Jimgerdemannia flammicorona]|uniref:Secreted protein n=1 Tax=Jimgerdemannia flammicorona TaxID=994334 RepID=A0A433PAR1_9FUNG|nr:hypothetical protein BC938DRAFT_477289 [Jimgerdemannia flammicorona]
MWVSAIVVYFSLMMFNSEPTKAKAQRGSFRKAPLFSLQLSTTSQGILRISYETTYIPPRTRASGRIFTTSRREPVIAQHLVRYDSDGSHGSPAFLSNPDASTKGSA